MKGRIIQGVLLRHKIICLQVVASIVMLQVYCMKFSVAEHAEVKYLPGFQGPLPFQLETGYIGVGEAEEVQLFYYFVKSQRNVKEDPLLLWLTGGPGCTALSGLFHEIGPLHFERVEYNGGLPTLSLNPYSWTQVASIIFVDSPVGTGFSYATNTNASHSSDSQQVQHLYQFFVKWLMEHPEFLSNIIYIGGDSYSGIIIPTLVRLISDANEEDSKPQINLKGYLEGNPITDNIIEANYKISFAHGMGLISDELYESLQRSCEGQYQNFKSSNIACLRDMMTFKELTLGYNNSGNILDPTCTFISPKPFQMFRKRSIIKDSQKLLEFNLPSPSLQCRSYTYLLSYYWIADNSVKKALHVKEGTVKKWIRCNFNLPYIKDITSTVKYHSYLSTKGYRSLIYSGDHDIIVPFLATQAWIRSLNYSIIDDWRPWHVAAQVAGYTRTYSNQMTFATVKGGGHTAPEFKPIECFVMFKRWISKEPL